MIISTSVQKTNTKYYVFEVCKNDKFLDLSWRTVPNSKNSDLFKNFGIFCKVIFDTSSIYKVDESRQHFFLRLI